MKSSSNFGGLLALGVCIILSVNKFTGTKRVVNVKGLATQEVMADHVIWPLVIQDVDNDLIIRVQFHALLKEPHKAASTGC